MVANINNEFNKIARGGGYTSSRSTASTASSTLPYLPAELQEMIFKARNNKSMYNAYTVQLYTLPDSQKAATIRAVNKNSRSITMNTLKQHGFHFVLKEQDMAGFFRPHQVPDYFSQNGYMLAPFRTYKTALTNILNIFPEGSRKVKKSETSYTVYIPKNTRGPKGPTGPK